MKHGVRELSFNQKFKLCLDVFREAVRMRPDLMDEWNERALMAEDREAQLKVMREGLRLTFRQRWPMPEEIKAIKNGEPLPADEVAVLWRDKVAA